MPPKTVWTRFFTTGGVIGSGGTCAGSKIWNKSAGQDAGVATPNRLRLLLRRSEKKSTAGFNLQLLMLVKY